MSEDGKSGAIKFKGLIQKPKMGVTKQHIIFMHTKKTKKKKNHARHLSKTQHERSPRIPAFIYTVDMHEMLVFA